MKRDADAGIFKHLGLKYGATVRFKDEFLKLVPSDLVKSPSPTTTSSSKPTMGEMSGFDAEMKRLYLAK